MQLIEISEKDTKLREMEEEKGKRGKTKLLAGDRLERLVQILQKQVKIEQRLKEDALKKLEDVRGSDSGEEARSVAFSTTRPSTTKSYKSTLLY